ncbi:MAG: hypothetical protein H7A23_22240 [Leptospiraceae bacterium]|nr:hypothetical protein [Leptospiraceae bacterium]MCP5497282.1 hypothetical protein [Leptospiraceae bacterium]
MHTIIKIFIITLVATLALEAEKLSDKSKVLLKGIGAIRIGMTVADAQKAGGVTFQKGHKKGSCVFLTPKGGPENITFIADKGKIMSVHIYAPSSIKTKSGVGIDSTEKQIKDAYPGQIKLIDTITSDGDTFQIFALVPKDKPVQNYRVIFTIHAGKVQDYAAGKLPFVKSRCD